MSGISLWRCSRCCEQVAVVVDGTKRFCGDCFYRQTVDKIMAAAFAPAPELTPLPPPPAIREAASAPLS
jgi:hypothetical protein